MPRPLWSRRGRAATGHGDDHHEDRDGDEDPEEGREPVELTLGVVDEEAHGVRVGSGLHRALLGGASERTCAVKPTCGSAHATAGRGVYELPREIPCVHGVFRTFARLMMATVRFEGGSMRGLMGRVGIAVLVCMAGLSAGATTVLARSTQGTSAAGAATSYVASFPEGAGSACVGIVVQDGRFKAYVCSLDEAFNLEYARWYEGKVGSNGAIRKTSPDGVTLKATVSGDTFTGEVTNAKNVPLSFDGGSVAVGTDHIGLYRGVGKYGGKPVLVGAVIDDDGTFASTTQYVGKIRFVTPVGDTPTTLGDKHLAVFLGPDETPYLAALVTALH